MGHIKTIIFLIKWLWCKAGKLPKHNFLNCFMKKSISLTLFCLCEQRKMVLHEEIINAKMLRGWGGGNSVSVICFWQYMLVPILLCQHIHTKCSNAEESPNPSLNQMKTKSLRVSGLYCCHVLSGLPTLGWETSGDFRGGAWWGWGLGREGL